MAENIIWPDEADEANDSYKKQVLGLIQERLKYLSEIPELTKFFFVDLPVDLNLIDSNKQLKKLEKTELIDLLKKAAATLESSDFTATDIQDRLNILLDETNQKPAVLFSIIRVATTWSPASPALADTLAVLGKDKSLVRLADSIEALS